MHITVASSTLALLCISLAVDARPLQDRSLDRIGSWELGGLDRYVYENLNKRQNEGEGDSTGNDGSSAEGEGSSEEGDGTSQEEDGSLTDNGGDSGDDQADATSEFALPSVQTSSVCSSVVCAPWMWLCAISRDYASEHSV